MTHLKVSERDEGSEDLEVVTSLLTTEQALLIQVVKQNFIDPFLAVTNRELDIRQDETKQELGLARDELAREHELKRHSLNLSAGLMALIVVIGGALLFVDKEAGLFLFSLVGIGVGTYSFGKNQPKN